MADAMIGVEMMAATGLYHGTMRTESPTPSGCARWLLRTSTTAGHHRAADALAEIRAAYPELPVPSIERLPDLVPLPELEHGFRATMVAPKDGSPRFWETPAFEPLDAGVMVRLAATGLIEEESCSGYDPDLSSVYTHFTKSDDRRTETPAA